MCNLIMLVEFIGLILIWCADGFEGRKQHGLAKQSLLSKFSVPNHQISLSEWSEWGPCNRRCIQRRERHCLKKEICSKKVIKQSKRCIRRGATCASNPPKIKKDKVKQMEETVYELLYGEWSPWSSCTRSCKKRRYRKCLNRKLCKGTVLLQLHTCYAPNSKCSAVHKKIGKRKDKNEDVKKKRPMSDVGNSKEKHPDKDNSKDRDNSKPDIHNSILSNDCGLRNTTASTRIIGGQESTHGSWPWQVAILTHKKRQYCGGVMITPQWVLTAAHCLRWRSGMRKVVLRIGEHDFEVKQGTEQDFKISKNDAKLHPDFNMKDIDSDIALVKLKRPIKNISQISYACLPERTDFLPEKTRCYVVGWGKMRERNFFGTDILMEAEVPLVSESRCQAAFDFKITANQMCAGYKKGGIDTCAGDSGGPLMCEITKNGITRWYVYGVTSFGEGCGDKGKYGIYTIVRNFHDWITNIIKNN